MFEFLQFRILQLLNRFCKDEEGATMVEYGIMVGVIACVALAGAQLLGTNLLNLFNAIAGVLAGVNPL